MPLTFRFPRFVQVEIPKDVQKIMEKEAKRIKEQLSPEQQREMYLDECKRRGLDPKRYTILGRTPPSHHCPGGPKSLQKRLERIQQHRDALQKPPRRAEMPLSKAKTGKKRKVKG